MRVSGFSRGGQYGRPRGIKTLQRPSCKNKHAQLIDAVDTNGILP